DVPEIVDVAGARIRREGAGAEADDADRHLETAGGESLHDPAATGAFGVIKGRPPPGCRVHGELGTMGGGIAGKDDTAHICLDDDVAVKVAVMTHGAVFH